MKVHVNITGKEVQRSSLVRGKWIERYRKIRQKFHSASSLVRGKWIERIPSIGLSLMILVFPREREVD